MRSLYAVIVSILFLSATQEVKARDCGGVIFFGFSSIIITTLSTCLIADVFDNYKKNTQIENLRTFLKMKLEHKLGQPGDVDKYIQLYEELKKCGDREATVTLGMAGIFLGCLLTFLTVLAGAE